MIFWHQPYAVWLPYGPLLKTVPAPWRVLVSDPEAKLRLDEADLRECVCCGAPTPTRSMCACWEHWMALPEDLRSELLASRGRGELTNYHRNLLRAVEIWRRCGLWRAAPR